MKIMDFLCPDAITIDLKAQDKKASITELIELQRGDLREIVQLRRAIAAELRRFLQGDAANQAKVLAWARRYGELDGEMSYLYGTAFARVSQSLTAEQKSHLRGLRSSDPRDPRGRPFLYSQVISDPKIGDPDFFFRRQP